MELSELVYRMVKDESLRSLMQVDIKKAIASVGADLSGEELEALMAVSWDNASLSPKTPQGPDQWWVRQLSQYPTLARPSTLA